MKQKPNSKSSSQKEELNNQNEEVVDTKSEEVVDTKSEEVVDTKSEEVVDTKSEEVLQPVVTKPAVIKTTKAGLKLSSEYEKRAKRLKLL
jgi:hypothetical protein